MVTKKIFIITVLVALIVGAGAVALLKNNSSTNNQTASTNSVQQGTSLDYSGQGLTTFPKAAFNRTDVTSLNLSNNQLSGALPGEIRSLSSLVTLDVSNNRMTGVPAEIGQLKNLKILNYNNNRLTGLPMELGNLTQLQTLDVSGNPKISQQDLINIRAKLTGTDIKF